MKAISLWQPWASAMAVGAKTIETRHWPTLVRGSIAIHAAKRCVKGEILSLLCRGAWQGAVVMPHIIHPRSEFHVEDLPYGAIVAVGTLVDCRPIETLTVGELDTRRYSDADPRKLYPFTERAFGDYSPGRFGWVFEDVKPLMNPIPFTGKQGFFNVPDELIREVEYA